MGKAWPQSMPATTRPMPAIIIPLQLLLLGTGRKQAKTSRFPNKAEAMAGTECLKGLLGQTWGYYKCWGVSSSLSIVPTKLLFMDSS